MLNIRKMRFHWLLLLGSLILLPVNTIGQNDKEEEIRLTTIKQIPALTVKSQASTSTCWCFATTSMLESELIRLGKGEVGLSEMFTVRNVYSDKAEQYVRFHGTCNFGEGGEAHDVLNSIRKYGIVPRDVYPGLNYGETNHKHGEIISSLSGVVESVTKNKNGKLSPVWLKGVNGVLDAYFGEKPLSFSYNGRMFTPQEFAKEMGINTDDYVEFTSFTHHPYYKKFVIEIPDNWSQDPVWNVPLDELMGIMDYALTKGISISWGADISDLDINGGFGRIMEPGGATSNALAPEKNVTPADRQYMFDSWQLTDDHLMHLMGIGQDQFGNKYYMEKNSWGERGKFKGYSYMSVPFMKLRTVMIMVHKDGIPPQIAEKIGLKK